MLLVGVVVETRVDGGVWVVEGLLVLGPCGWGGALVLVLALRLLLLLRLVVVRLVLVLGEGCVVAWLGFGSVRVDGGGGVCRARVAVCVVEDGHA